MRIGMMIDSYFPYVSGVTHWVRINKRALEQAGHRVFVFTLGARNYRDEEPDVIRSPGIPLGGTGVYVGFRYPGAARQLLSTVDLVHVHHPFTSGRLALRYCRPAGIPVVFTNHTRYDLYARAYLPFVPAAWTRGFLNRYMAAFCRAVDLVIAPSLGLREVLHGQGVDVPVEVLPNGVDLEPFRRPARAPERSALGFSAEDVVLVYVGRLGPEKNLSFLLDSFAGVHAGFPHARLLLVGDGPLRSALERQAQRDGIGDAVHFAGMVDYPQVPGFLALSDIFVSASVTEGHPLTLIEALASGLPAVGIRSPGVQDTIVDGRNGLLADADQDAFRAAMDRLIRDPDLRRRLAEGARATSEEYSIERTSARLQEHYRRLIDTRRGSRPAREESPAPEPARGDA